jgi:hypothetical protein
MPLIVANLFALENPVTLIILASGLIPFALFLWAIIDVAQRPLPTGASKAVWCVLIVLVPVLGPLIYLIVGRKG